jgi:SAM-dependent methyltransferase
MASAAGPIVALSTAGASGPALFDRFVTAVVRRQLAEWLPAQPATLLDLSLDCPYLLGPMVDRGHTVVHADARRRRLDIVPQPERDAGRLLSVRADPRLLDWVRSESVDEVVAEGAVLSQSLAAEVAVEEMHRVLRPGGRVLVSVDSLVAGLSRLADQGRWAELADVPAADVVLIPGEGDAVSRCFWPEELDEMLAGCGFVVEWIRPRTVLAEETVTQALTLDPSRMSSLVRTELALAARREGESVGPGLIASARKR